MYDEAYLAECHLEYCSKKAELAWDDCLYFLAAFYEGIEIYWHIMYATHGGL